MSSAIPSQGSASISGQRPGPVSGRPFARGSRLFIVQGLLRSRPVPCAYASSQAGTGNARIAPLSQRFLEGPKRRIGLGAPQSARRVVRYDRIIGTRPTTPTACYYIHDINPDPSSLSTYHMEIFGPSGFSVGRYGFSAEKQEKRRRVYRIRAASGKGKGGDPNRQGGRLGTPPDRVRAFPAV